MTLHDNSLEDTDSSTAIVTGLYTKGGGTYTRSAESYTWAFLYQGDQQYGIVFTNGSEHFVLLGKTTVETVSKGGRNPRDNGITVDTSDMQNTVNGHGDEW